MEPTAPPLDLCSTGAGPCIFSAQSSGGMRNACLSVLLASLVVASCGGSPRVLQTGVDDKVRLEHVPGGMGCIADWVESILRG